MILEREVIYIQPELRWLVRYSAKKFGRVWDWWGFTEEEPDPVTLSGIDALAQAAFDRVEKP